MNDQLQSSNWNSYKGKDTFLIQKVQWLYSQKSVFQILSGRKFPGFVPVRSTYHHK